MKTETFAGFFETVSNVMIGFATLMNVPGNIHLDPIDTRPVEEVIKSDWQKIGRDLEKVMKDYDEIKSAGK